MVGQGLYIQLFSVHGLIRGVAPELGRDADTGGQVKYVLELAKALAAREDVARVDLVTRRIEDRRVAPDYGTEVEALSDKARLVRIRCGGRKYLRKELLWPHLEEFIDKSIKFVRKQRRVPDIVHGHYADAGYVAMELGKAFDIPFVFTGHSLGRSKKEKLLADGLSTERINKHYAMDTRIAVEEEIIREAGLIVTSTQQEIDRQYGLYAGAGRGRYAVIPPGIDLDVFYPYYNHALDPESLREESKQIRLALLHELRRFWTVPDKPFILALCRPDHRKNITGLIEAYGTSKELRAIANLAVFAGIRQDIAAMEENERQVLTDMLLQMDRFDLYGKLAIPKRHDFATEVPELYRLCAESRGVFVNPALIEPFGLTLIEASACGLPIVATNDGGPVDIVANCHSGILVDARQPAEINRAIRSILVDDKRWDKFSGNGVTGVRSHYSWPSHCQKMMRHLGEAFPQFKKRAAVRAGGDAVAGRDATSFAQRLTGIRQLMMTDIDNTLVGDDSSLRHLLELFGSHRDTLAWGVATGRSLELTLEVMGDNNIPMPDILVCSVGTEIYYGPDLRRDRGWQQHISHRWRPDQIRAALEDLPCLSLQGPEGQRSHKISYYLRDDPAVLAEVRRRLQVANLPCQVIYSHGRFLDILPYRASKGRAIRYLKYKYEFAASDILVAGDSGNDEDMIRGSHNGLVVANHSRELEHLRGASRVYFSGQNHAAGIIDGLLHYGFLMPDEVPPSPRSHEIPVAL